MTKTLPNRTGGIPLISILLSCHDGDVHLVKRAATSLRLQQLQDFDVHVAYDGPPPAERYSELLNEAFHGFNCPVHVWFGPEKTGYYTAPRNRAFLKSYGLYIAQMDADNEFEPEHLFGLLSALRTPLPDGNLADFAYCRRRYVKDPECTREVFEGDTKLIPWTAKNVQVLLKSGPKANFVDTGDALFPRGVLIRLGEMTGGNIWNPSVRRFGDYEMISRIARCGFGGKAVDQASNVYHWTGANLQLNRGVQDFVAIPEDIYDRMVMRGQVVDNRFIVPGGTA